MEVSAETIEAANDSIELATKNIGSMQMKQRKVYGIPLDNLMQSYA